MTAPEPGRSYLSSAAALALAAKFADNVNLLLLARGWSRTELAKRSSIPLRTVENILQLNTTPTLVGAAGIAKALDTTVDTLLGAIPQEELPWVGTGPFTCTHTDSHLRDSQGNSRGFCSLCLSRWQQVQAAKNGLYMETRRQHLAATPLTISQD